MSILSVVGIGPGRHDQMTAEARSVLEEADLIAGYQLYVDLIRDLFPEKTFYTTGMKGERERVAYAVDCAMKGIRTAVVCSGDAQVYGMAPLVFEMARLRGLDPGEILIVPGITAALSCGAVLGAPLSCDFAVISLSDLMTPWERIAKKLDGAARGDLPIVLYNPGSGKRRNHLLQACRIVGRYRREDTVCAVVRNAGRAGQSYRLLTLKELESKEVDMLSTVFIGNEESRVVGNRMVTPRGYEKKYDLTEARLTSPGSEEEPAAAGKRSSDPVPYPGEGASEKRALLIFGGTIEGRRLAEAARDSGYETTLSVVSDYGRETASLSDSVFPGTGIRILTGVMPEEQIRKTLSSGRFRCVIDATHPYAVHISGSIDRAAEAAGIRKLRIARRTGIDSDSETAVEKQKGHLLSFADMKRVIDFLNEEEHEGTVFFTTGSKAAGEYARLRNLSERAFIRILPSEEALSKVKSAGFPSSHIFCMQGPFSEEMNLAFFRDTGAEWLVTKASGKEGGFDSKLSAARKLGMKVLIIRPPVYEKEASGKSFEDVLELIRGGRL